MKILLQILGKIVLSLIILVAILVIFRNPIVKAGAQIGAKVMAGVPLSVEKIDISLTKSYLLIKGLRIGNPSGFSNEELLHMPEFYVDYNFWTQLWTCCRAFCFFHWSRKSESGDLCRDIRKSI